MATINGTAGNDVLQGTDGADTIYGLAGDDTIDGGFGADSLYGGDGADLFRFSSVAVSNPAPTAVGIIDGGAGYDTVDWSNISPVTLGTIQNAAGRYVLGAYVGTQKFELTGIERINFGSRDDTISPAFGAGGLEIYAGAGNDTVYANAGDRIYGEDGNDRIWLSGSYGGPLLSGLASGGAGLDTLRTNIAFTVDMIAGTASAGTARYSISDFENLEMSTYTTVAVGYGDDKPNVMSVNSNSSQGDLGVLFDGRGGDDRLLGSRAADTLEGGSGNDFLEGGAGDDRLSGGMGNDVLAGGTGNDTLVGGEGHDTTAYTGFYREYGVTTTAAVTQLSSGSEGSDTLSEMEAVTFRDGILSFDSNDPFAKVMRMYDTLQQRQPDGLGQEFWTDMIRDGKITVQGMASEFMKSSEFQSVTGNLSNQAFVEFMYQQAHGRAPDASGRDYWIGKLVGGMDRSELVLEFSESAEHRAKTASTVAQGYFDTDNSYQAITLLYDSFAGRKPDADGLTFWAERLKSGEQTIGQIANEFSSSTEFKSQTGSLSNGELVEYMYHNTLDRAPDAGGKMFWTGQLDHGVSRASFLAEFSQSAEHHGLLHNEIIGGIDIIA